MVSRARTKEWVTLRSDVDLAYAAQTESGDKVITIRGHVSIVRGVPE